MAGAGFKSECFDTEHTEYISIHKKLTRGIEYRDAAKKMVAKGKTYGKKKGRDLASIFLDLSISPSKPGTKDLLPLYWTYGLADRSRYECNCAGPCPYTQQP